MAHKSNPWKKSTAKVSFARHPAWRQPLALVLPRNVAEERQAEIERAPTEQQSRCQMPRRSQKDFGGAYVLFSCEAVGRKRWRIIGECSDSASTARCRTEPRSLAVFATWTNACQAARQERLLGGACGGVVVLLDTLIRLNMHNNRDAGPFLWEPRTCVSFSAYVYKGCAVEVEQLAVLMEVLQCFSVLVDALRQ